MQLLELNEANSTVRFPMPEMMLDLGSIGKGYALDMAAEILCDSGVENALLHGGTSTIIGLGSDPDGAPWKVVIEKSPEAMQPQVEMTEENAIAIVPLQNRAISVSAVWGKSFTIENKMYGHVIDPRTGWPSDNAVLGAAMLESAAETDALSTAVLLDHENELKILGERRPELAYLQIRSEKGGVMKKASRGFECRERISD